MLVLNVSDYASDDMFVCLHEKVACLTSAEVSVHLDEAQRPVTSGLTQRVEGNEVITFCGKDPGFEDSRRRTVKGEMRKEEGRKKRK
jgi:hypothetical protein